MDAETQPEAMDDEGEGGGGDGEGGDEKEFDGMD